MRRTRNKCLLFCLFLKNKDLQGKEIREDITSESENEKENDSAHESENDERDEESDEDQEEADDDEVTVVTGDTEDSLSRDYD